MFQYLIDFQMIDNRIIIPTDDGYHSVFAPNFNEPYHSIHGAVQESQHVYINAGFLSCSKTDICVFEMGFGTGLNALLTLLESEKLNKSVNYFCVEKFPLAEDMYNNLNFNNLENRNLFLKLHEAEWNKAVTICDNFTLHKYISDIIDYQFVPEIKFDVVYFDAFAPDKQPEVWQLSVFVKLYQAMNLGGVLTTYSTKGYIKQLLRNLKFEIKRLKGPKGKHHMLKATKIELIN